MKRYPLFISRNRGMWEDGWTYGDWRQYVCQRGDTTQCARISRLHIVFPIHWFGFWIMRAVGPLNRGDSGAWRVLPGEETKA